MIEFAATFPPDDELKKEFSENVLLEVQFQENTSLDVDMGQVIEVPTAPPYKGEYEVIPKFTEEVLKTERQRGNLPYRSSTSKQPQRGYNSIYWRYDKWLKSTIAK